jgi:hypothetical protein
MPETVFIAYPSQPGAIGTAIATAAGAASMPARKFETWAQADIFGRFIIDGILAKIDAAALVGADITRLNANVMFEIAYAIGKKKRVILVVNSALNPDFKDIAKLGIFDTLGYKPYANADALAGLFRDVDSTLPLNFPEAQLDRATPIYVLETLYKTDAALRIIARIKKARLGYRSFDPAEQPRLSALEAIQDVLVSAATVVHLLSEEATDHQFNNLRGAFIAGLSYGLARETLILQERPEQVPLDYRDFVVFYKSPDDIDKPINELVPRVTELVLSVTEPGANPRRGGIADINLGASAAENEIMHLGQYYVPTDQYTQALSGNVRLAVGRKGSGKSALFFQLRDKIRSDRKVVVLDLRPEGHQLKRFKDAVLQVVGEAVQDHLVAAFWEYVILLELCHKILEKDRTLHVHDHTIYAAYVRLAGLYEHDELIAEGYFSERMQALVQRIVNDFHANKNNGGGEPSAKEVVQLIYKHDMGHLRAELGAYLKLKKGAWVLFDNIDKGWPTRGVALADIVQLRGLVEATRNIERHLQRVNVDMHTLIFLRNDVYELLVNDTPDRGKETRVSLDWSDGDMLRELYRRRFVFGTKGPPDLTFAAAWARLFVSHIDGEDMAEYLIERSLMRPRNFLNLVNACKSVAVNLQHERVLTGDVLKAAAVYSGDIASELGLEIRDVFPSAEDLLYQFLGSAPRLTLKELYEVFAKTGVPAERRRELAEILLWFCFLGVVPREGARGGQEIYAYSVQYDMKKLRHLAADLTNDDAVFAINKAFWPFLEISSL